MNKKKRIISLVISMVILFLTINQETVKLSAAVTQGNNVIPLNEGELINNATQWKYLDDNSDPAIGNDKTSWTASSFDDSLWKIGSGSFGSKKGDAVLGNGYTASVLLNQYIDGTSTNIPTFFFRSKFTIDSLDNMKELVGQIQYDDAAIVYINGIKVAEFDVPAGGYTSNMSYGGSGASDPKTATFTVSSGTVKLYEGENNIAVEIHQVNESSSDIFFNFQNLKLETMSSTVDVIQKSIILSMGSNASERNITWYADDSNPGELQLALKNDMISDVFPMDKCTTYTACVQPALDTGFYSNQLTINNLLPDTDYIYRLQNGNTISDVYGFHTGCKGNFSFLLAGDPQIGASGNPSNDEIEWQKTLTKGLDYFPNTDFIISAGDQVNTASNEVQYAGFLNHNGFKSIPLATVVGNHDTASAAYNQHFNITNAGTYGTTAAGSDYWYVYNNALFLNLNSNNLSTAEHKAFMEEAIQKNPQADWKFVIFHHSIYSVASHANDKDILQRREALVPVFKELDIDVVLMGHDHVYTRSFIMDGFNPIVETNSDGTPLKSVLDPEGVLYVTANSATGSKYYAIKNQTFEFAAVKTQENVPNISNIEVTKESVNISTYRINDMSVVDTFQIQRSVEPNTKPVTVISKDVKGIENNISKLDIKQIARYDSKTVNPDGGSSEIVKFNHENGHYYVVNGTTGYLDKVPRMLYDGSGNEESNAIGNSIDVKTKLKKFMPSFNYGDMTSVDVNTELDIIAVGVQAVGTNDDSLIVFLTYDGAIIHTVWAGKQVDMITFTKDGRKLLAANEGEPREGYGLNSIDPKGSVTVVDLSNGLDKAISTNITFDAMDTKRESLITEGVIIKKNTNPSVDFEPEYIAVDSSGKYAYVSLQEANAIATLDLETNTFITVKSLGFKDHNKTENSLDMKKDNKINIKTENIYGIYMPDSIEVYEVNGKKYLLTANEGDSRDWPGYKNELERKLDGSEVVTFDTSDYDGVDPGKTYLFGGRSFSIYDAATMEQIYDSGNDFERITASALPNYFNCSNDKTTMDNRSGKKGPEAEGITIGKVGKSTYAFIGLERIGGIMVYDITKPAKPKYVNYINSRDFDAKIAGDVSPEGLCFVSKEDSGSGVAELLVAFEVSGTVGIFQMNERAVEQTVPSDPIPSNPIPSIPTPKTPTPTNENKEIVNTSIKGGSNTSTSITLKWDKVLNASGYEIWRYNTNIKSYNLITSLDKNVTSYIDKNLKTGTTYRYIIKTYQITDGEKYYSNNSEEYIISTNPSTPNISVKADNKKLTLSWNKVTGANGYQIYLSDKKDGSYDMIKTINNSQTLSYTKKGLISGKTYYVKIRAYRIEGGKKYYSSFSKMKVSKIN